MTMGKMLERFGKARIIDETNGFGLNFIEKTESRFLEHHPRRGSSTLKKDGFGTFI